MTGVGLIDDNIGTSGPHVAPVTSLGGNTSALWATMWLLSQLT